MLERKEIMETVRAIKDQKTIEFSVHNLTYPFLKAIGASCRLQIRQDKMNF